MDFAGPSVPGAACKRGQNSRMADPRKLGVAGLFISSEGIQMARQIVCNAVLVLLSVLSALSQSGDYTQVGVPSNSPQIPIPLGFIAPLTGQVHMEIPLATMSARNGIGVKARFSYDTSVITCPIGGPPTLCYGGGPQFGFVSDTDTELLSEWTATKCPSGYDGNAGIYRYFRVIDSNGQPHYISGTGTSPPQINIYNCLDPLNNKKITTPPQSLSAFSTDGQYYFSLRYGQTDGSNGDIVWSLNGSVVYQTGTSSSAFYDTNGNYLFQQHQLPGEYTTNPVTSSVSNGSCGTAQQNPNYVPDFDVIASDGTANTYTVNCTTYTVATNTTVTLITSLTLPDGTQYGFSYDPTHNYVLNGVTLPTGGTMSFTYGSAFYNTLPQLLSATFNGGTWTFTHTRTGSAPSYLITSTATSPPRYDAPSQSYISDKSIYTSTAWGGNTADPFYLANVQYYSGTSTLLKTVSATYSVYPTNPAPYNCLLSLSTTLNDTGQTSQTQYQYATACSILTQKQEFDYGVTTPTRTTKISYLADTSSTAYNSMYHIYNRPVSVSVYAGAGTSGSPVAATTYAYDEYGANYCKVFNGNAVPMLANITGAINHDDAGHSSTFYARGNVTSTSKLVSGSSYVTSHTCYDTLGNVTQTVDESGNPTNLDYTENWADTACEASGTLTRELPTTITDPMGNRLSTRSYSCTRLPEAVADENDLDANPSRSGITYNYDFAGRPLCINYPDGGETCNAYFMTYSTETTSITSAVSMATKTIVDGYGRVTESQITTDPEGIDYTDTTYDELGRKASVNNPYRSSADPTYGITYYYYDALGRSTSVVEPDGSSVTTSYSGNTTTATDEIGNKRKTQTDGLGRLTSVWEDPSTLNFETDYTYDILDDLICVQQQGGVSTPSGTGCAYSSSGDSTSPWRIRRFSYDGLSRLTSSTNPESGAEIYTYYANGPVQTKTAPAPNQTGTATLTTDYSYDADSRLTQQSYPGTTFPTITFWYDGAAPSGCTPAPPTVTDSNPKGYRTAMCDGSGATSWNHDSLGRILGSQEKIGTSSAEGVSYAYNLDGSLFKITDPLGGNTVQYNPGGAGRPLNAVDSAGHSYVTSATYAPFGALTGMVNGYTSSFSGINASNSYSSRLQPTVLSASTSSATVFSLSYGYRAKGKNNGNISQIVNNSNNSRTQNFTYDSLNRISTAASQATSGQYCWGQLFGYYSGTTLIPGIDAWGNLNQVTTSQCSALSFNQSSSYRNQITGFCYDSAGNLLDAIWLPRVGHPYVLLRPRGTAPLYCRRQLCL